MKKTAMTIKIAAGGILVEPDFFSAVYSPREANAIKEYVSIIASSIWLFFNNGLTTLRKKRSMSASGSAPSNPRPG